MYLDPDGIDPIDQYLKKEGEIFEDSERSQYFRPLDDENEDEISFPFHNCDGNPEEN